MSRGTEGHDRVDLDLRRTEMGTQVNMNTRVAGVHKALVAADDVTDKSHVVVVRPKKANPQICVHSIVICTRILAVRKRMECTRSLSASGVNIKHQHMQERTSVQ